MKIWDCWWNQEVISVYHWVSHSQRYIKNSHSGVTEGGKHCLKHIVLLSHTSKENSYLCIWTDITCRKF